jgi:hypothetical protein
MSPFEAEVARLGAIVMDLSRQGQVAFLVAAARALMPRYLEWLETASPSSEGKRVLLDVLEEAERFVLGTPPGPPSDLLASAQLQVPEEPSDAMWFTTAQDCWICADSALRVALNQYHASDAMWFVLEPLFQATSERLFGVSDVGSDRQQVDEARALEDASMRAGLAAVDDACRRLHLAARVTRQDLEHCVGSLAAIRP